MQKLPGFASISCDVFKLEAGKTGQGRWRLRIGLGLGQVQYSRVRGAAVGLEQLGRVRSGLIGSLMIRPIVTLKKRLVKIHTYF